MSRWSDDELVLAMELYCGLPFGKMHRRNPQVMELAQAIGRTPDAVAMKLGNFASQDPAERARGIRGLSGASQADARIFATYAHDMERLARDVLAAAARLGPAASRHEDEQDATAGQNSPVAAPASMAPLQEIPAFSGPTEAPRTVMARRAQSLFRRAVLTSYGDACAMCDLAVVVLLQASHIIPWSTSEARRADPRNGLALCTLHDRAFDRGLVTIGEDLRIRISERLRIEDACEVHRVAFLAVADRPLRLPVRFMPDPDALRFHRDEVFVA